MPLQLWTEQHRPRTMDEYVWRDQGMRKMVEGWVASGGLPHAMFSGKQGTGKSSMALLVLRLLNIPAEDILIINASRERKIEGLQDKIIDFINAWAFGETGIKYILLDEADKLSQLAQGMLRNEMETYAHTCRFLLTCNYPNKIIPALHSRLQEIKFTTLNVDEFMLRCADVLIKENVQYDVETLMLYQDRAYPDLRKTIGLLQQNTQDGKLQPPRDDDTMTRDYLLTVIELFTAGHYLEGRKLVIEQADPEEYQEVYRFFYENLHLFGKTQDQQDEAILAIRKAIVYDGQVADRELNLAAALVELTRIAKPSF